MQKNDITKEYIRISSSVTISVLYPAGHFGFLQINTVEALKL